MAVSFHQLNCAMLRKIDICDATQNVPTYPIAGQVGTVYGAGWNTPNFIDLQPLCTFIYAATFILCKLL